MDEHWRVCKTSARVVLVWDYLGTVVFHNIHIFKVWPPVARASIPVVRTRAFHFFIRTLERR